MEVDYQPGRHERLPVEVVQRSAVLERIAGRELVQRQRVGFHQLVVCLDGEGVHHVDFEPLPLRAGTVLRIYPGQVQRFSVEPAFEALMVLWPSDFHHQDPSVPMWYPGSGVPTTWEPDPATFARIVGWVEELRTEQDLFDGSQRYIDLLQVLLCAFLMRLAIALPSGASSAGRLPASYVAFREFIEERLYDQPTVAEAAEALHYSTRTLDRACKDATGLTARQVLDERIALEIRRLLTHTTRSVGRIGRDFGFSDPSNFSKWVVRHLGTLPGDLRSDRA